MLISALRKVIKVQSFKQHICSTSTQLMCEAEKARQRALQGFTDEPTIFDKIIAKEIPADIFYEDEKCMAFNDVAPQAPVHFLVIPKIRIPKLEDAQPEHQGILGHLMQIAGKLGKSRAPEGFRLVVNNGAAGCQSVYYLHLHVLGGRQLTWPPG